MSTMRAVVVDPDVQGHLALHEVELPSPAPAEALIRVSAISLNLGEVRTARLRAEAGWRPGWELAGVVEQAAIDGSGPSVGARVFGMVGFGAWAECVAVPTAQLAEIPDGATFAQAATLPVAGLTALYGLERGALLLNRKVIITGGPENIGHIYGLERGPMLLKRKVLVTGASGGVGHFACQLARREGALVTALVRRAERAASVQAMGVHEVVIGEDAALTRSLGPYHLVIDTVGGNTLRTAMTLLETDGICVNLGAAENPEMTLQNRYGAFDSPDNEQGFVIRDIKPRRVAKDLGRLVQMMVSDQLHPHIGQEAPWTDVVEVTQSLLDRRIAGKAVLYVS
ncbi:zinc-binding dehydrogenase [Ktedonospora formicarum]|uniref:Oxidoreductase n=1 Tax=Ktedonospora formicarum TaxID=2778364 RepID=A0A8J3I913_9CHLR|nr:zinc-binding dehydrogenase [Ktedonospora formicarum]GHO49050.1 oxidoreductase [Ktedonospora formicarum]